MPGGHRIDEVQSVLIFLPLFRVGSLQRLDLLLFFGILPENCG